MQRMEHTVPTRLNRTKGAVRLVAMFDLITGLMQCPTLIQHDGSQRSFTAASSHHTDVSPIKGRLFSLHTKVREWVRGGLNKNSTCPFWTRKKSIYSSIGRSWCILGMEFLGLAESRRKFQEVSPWLKTHGADEAGLEQGSIARDGNPLHEHMKGSMNNFFRRNDERVEEWPLWNI